MPLVLDTSAALTWAFTTPNPSDPLLQRLRGEDALVPDIWPAEVANGLVVATRRGFLSIEQRTAFLHRLHHLPIVVEVTGAERTFGAILALAERYGLSVYDASYLELARREGCALATGDAALGAAARKEGLEILV